MKPVLKLIAAASLALLAACSARPAPATAGGAPSVARGAVAYSHCVRSHGVPDFPDPASGGGIPKAIAQQLGVSQSRLQTAQDACRPLLPDATSFDQQTRQCLTAGACPAALVQQMLTADRTFARCMRSHGVPGWPDPTTDSAGRPVFNLVPAGITHSQTHSPPISGHLGECQHLDPAPAAMESN